MSEKKLRKIRAAFASATLVSLDAPLPTHRTAKLREGDSLTLSESVTSTLPTPLEVALFGGLRSELTDSMQAVLTPPERDVIRLRLGLDGGETQSRGEVASLFSLSKYETAQIEKRALSKLRSRVDREWLEFDQDLEASAQVSRGAVDFIG